MLNMPVSIGNMDGPYNNPQKYSAEYELMLKDDNEKDRLHNLLYKIEERYNNESADLMELIREI